MASCSPARAFCRFLGSVDRFTYADDKFRPDYRRRRGYTLPAEHRQQLCVHLAAHAAVNSLGGAFVYMLAVAPAGVRSWTTNERKSRSLGKLWGLCSTSDFLCRDIRWDEAQQSFVGDREAWEQELKSLHVIMTQFHQEAGDDALRLADSTVPAWEEFLGANRRIVRAQACGYLAGHIADGIAAGMTADKALQLYDRRDTQFVGGASDIVVAQGLADLLPPGEYENAVRLTEEVLQQPAMSKSVERLSRELGEFGLLEGDECEFDMSKCLPKPVPDWPPAPGQDIALHL